MRIADKPFTALPKQLLQQIKFMSPNIYELNAIATSIGECEIIENTEIDVEHLFLSDQNLLRKIKTTAEQMTELIDNVIVTIGARGVILSRKITKNEMRFFNEKNEYILPNGVSKLESRLYRPHVIPNIVNVSGAGDSFTSGFIAAMIRGKCQDVCVSVGLDSAKTALQTHSAVPAKYNGTNHSNWSQKADYKLI